VTPVSLCYLRGLDRRRRIGYVETFIIVGCLAYIARWIYKAVQAGREGWAEGQNDNLRRQQDERAKAYENLRDDDWEALGLSNEWLREHVGPRNYYRLMMRWYPDPVTHTALDSYLASLADRKRRRVG
jgi:hypothetical protein